MKYFDHILKSILDKAGFEIHRFPHRSNPYFQLLKGLEYFNVNQILDVGANTGQFSLNIFKVGYTGKIISYEPLESAHKQLLKNSESFNNWVIHPRCAIGDYDGSIVINESKNSVSSSILTVLDTHIKAAPNSKFIGEATISINKLNTAADSYVDDSKITFLKMDVQGYEWNILNGANKILPRIKGILCEISLIPLYKDQRLWLDVIKRIEYEGFELWNIQPGFTDVEKGRTLQVDATFFKL